MRAHRLRTGERVTYESLSRKTGLSKATLEAIGSRPRYNATLRTLGKLMEALDCELADLIEVDR